MAGFAPQLQSDIGYDTVVNEGAGGLGVLSSLASLIPAKKAPKAPSKPTKDERLGQAWKDTFSDTSIQESTLADQRKFARLFPEGGASWVKDQANALNNQALNDETEAQNNENDVASAVALKWGASPEAQIASTAAARLPKEEQDLFLAQAQTAFFQNTVDQNRLQDNVAVRGANKANREEAYRLGAVGAIGLANAMSNALHDFTDAVGLDPNSTLNLDEAGIGAIMPSLAGITLNKNNVQEVTGRLRDAFKTMTLQRISQDSGIPVDQLGLMPEALESQIFKSFDAMNAWSVKRVDPSEIRKRMTDENWLEMVDQDLPLAFISNVAIVSAADPKLKAMILSTMTKHGEKILEAYNNGDFEFVKDAARAMSREERKTSFAALSQVAKAWGGTSTVAKIYDEVGKDVRNTNFAHTSMAAVEMAKAEMGENLLLGPNFWKENIEGTSHMWEGAAEVQPEFTRAMTATLTGDVNANMTFVNTAAEKLGFKPVMNDAGVITLERGGAVHEEKMSLFADTIELNKARDPAAVSRIEADRDAYLSEVPKTLFATVDGEEVDVLKGANYRYNVLGSLGDIGKQVRINAQTAFSQPIADAVAAALVKGQGSVQRNGIITSTLPPKEAASVSNGPIAQKLGLDFGAVEQEYGLPTGYLERTAQIESSGNPAAKNPRSSAGGLFQQINANAKEFGVTDRFDANQSTVGAAKFAKQNAVKLRKVLGREPTGAELYLAHQQGGAGASRLLRDRSRLVNTILSNDAITLNGGRLDMTAGEFADIWINKWNKGVVGGQATNAAQSTTTTDVSTDTDAAVAQAMGDLPEATVDLGIAPVSPASDAGSFVGTPTGEGENLETDRTGGEAQKPPAVKARLASERLRENVDPKVARQLKSLGIEAEEVDTFATQEEAQEAINRGELKEGDAMMVDGELFIIEGA